MRLYVGSTPFVPAGWSGTIRVEHIPLEEVGSILADAAERGDEIISFVGHPGTARYLGVPMSRAEASLAPGQRWVGIRPTRRPKPGEELDPALDPSAFVGWVMEVE